LVAQDTVALDKSYQYLIIANGAAGAKSNAPRTSSVVAAYTETWGTPSVTATVTDLANKKVTVSWTAENCVEYSLARALITTTNGVSGSWTEGTYETITLTNANSSIVNDHQTVIDTLSAYRTSYRYKLTAVKAGLTKTATSSITTAPFNSYSVEPSLNTTAASTTVNYAINVVVSNVSGYNADLQAQVYQAEYNDSEYVEESQWTAIGSRVDFTGTQATVVSSGLDPLKRYIYRVVISTTTGTLQNTATSSYLGIYPSTAFSDLQSSFSYVGNISTAEDGVYVWTSSATAIAANQSRYVGARIFISERNATSSFVPTSIATVAVNNTATDDITTVPGVTIPAWSYYFKVPRPAYATTGTDTYYYGSESSGSIQSISKSATISITGSTPTYRNY
jgi:hypothetical protein